MQVGIRNDGAIDIRYRDSFDLCEFYVNIKDFVTYIVCYACT